MNDANLVLFLAASLVVIVAPGPDNILVLTRGVTLGRKAALVSAAGASTGLVCHSLFAAAGLSAILRQSAVAYSVVKYVGAAYLIYLGVRALMDREAFVLSGDGAPALSLRRVYAQAVASNVFNPKIAVFFLAYLPQFADRSVSGGVAPQLLALGLAFAAMTMVRQLRRTLAGSGRESAYSKRYTERPGLPFVVRALSLDVFSLSAGTAFSKNPRMRASSSSV